MGKGNNNSRQGNWLGSPSQVESSPWFYAGKRAALPKYCASWETHSQPGGSLAPSMSIMHCTRERENTHREASQSRPCGHAVAATVEQTVLWDSLPPTLWETKHLSGTKQMQYRELWLHLFLSRNSCTMDVGWGLDIREFLIFNI